MAIEKAGGNRVQFTIDANFKAKAAPKTTRARKPVETEKLITNVIEKRFKTYEVATKKSCDKFFRELENALPGIASREARGIIRNEDPIEKIKLNFKKIINEELLSKGHSLRKSVEGCLIKNKATTFSLTDGWRAEAIFRRNMIETLKRYCRKVTENSSILPPEEKRGSPIGKENPDADRVNQMRIDVYQHVNKVLEHIV